VEGGVPRPDALDGVWLLAVFVPVCAAERLFTRSMRRCLRPETQGPAPSLSRSRGPPCRLGSLARRFEPVPGFHNGRVFPNRLSRAGDISQRYVRAYIRYWTHAVPAQHKIGREGAKGWGAWHERAVGSCGESNRFALARTGGRGVAEVVELREAVAGLVGDGDSVALEGFTHLIPTAVAHEIVRQERRDLTLIRMTPDLIYDQMIGMGCASKLIFSWGGNPGVGSLHRFRDAVEHGWPRPLEIEEHSHAGMANRYVAGASNLPFAVLRGYVGTDLPKVTSTIAPITCPFTGEELMAVPALRPDVAVIHAQQADRRGNVAIWGIVGIQKEAVMSARKVIVTVEEIVDELEPHPFQVILPSVVVDAISVVPFGAHPSYADGYYDRDNAFYEAWDPIGRDRERFGQWMERHVLGTEGWGEYLEIIGEEELIRE
jgi:glutaconate CoA-transferase, subunit A